MKTNLKHILFTTSLIILGACTPYTESFDCPPGLGVGCQSLSTVNQMVEEGTLPYGKLPYGELPHEKLPLEDDSSDKEKKNLFSQEPSMIEAKAPLKAIPALGVDPRSHIKVWLAGYEESRGSDRFYHAPSLVYVTK